MSRRRNGTNRAQAAINASRYTGYGKPTKRAVTLAEVNDHIRNKIQGHYILKQEENQDGRK